MYPVFSIVVVGLNTMSTYPDLPPIVLLEEETSTTPVVVTGKNENILPVPSWN
jgi:hypothetical protein